MHNLNDFKDRWKRNKSACEDFCNLLPDPDAFSERFSSFLIKENGREFFDFRGISISKREIVGGFFVDLDLSYSTFRACRIVNSTIHSSKVINVDFSSSEIISGGVFNSEITGCNFSKVYIEGCILGGLNFNGCLFNKTILNDVNFSESDLSNNDILELEGKDVALFKARIPKAERQKTWWNSTPEDKIIWV